MKTIAVLQIGHDGFGHGADRLLGGGLTVTVYNRTASRADTLKEVGAKVAQSPREAAMGADVVIAMLADDAASRSAWVGENGALAAARPGAVLVESSTLSVNSVTELAAAARSPARSVACSMLPSREASPRRRTANSCSWWEATRRVLDSVRDVLAPMSRRRTSPGPYRLRRPDEAGQQLPVRRAGGVTCGSDGDDRTLRLGPRSGDRGAIEWRAGESAAAHTRGTYGGAGLQG